MTDTQKFKKKRLGLKKGPNYLRQDPICLLEKRMQKNRIVVTTCYLLLGCLAYAAGAVSGHGVKVLGAMSLMPLSSIGSLWLINKIPSVSSRITAISLVMHTLLTTWVIFWTGGETSPCLPFYLTAVMAASFRFGLYGSLVYTLLAILCYCVAGTLPFYPAYSFQEITTMVLRILLLFAAAGFGIWALHNKHERYRKERELRKKLQKVNQKLSAAYQELQATQDQLLHAEKLASIGRLVAGVAHEINNPISFIYGNLVHLETYVNHLKALIALDDKLYLSLPEASRRQRDDMKRTADYDFLQEDIDRVLKSSSNGVVRVQNLVKSLLNYSHFRKGPLQKVKIQAPLENALCILEGKIKTNTRIIREYKTNATINGDTGELSQLFLNLLTNAADALQKNGTIWISCYNRQQSGRPDTTCVEIRDNGSGISPDDRDRIFEPFFTTKEVGRGTGLGLSIAYSITKRHKGELSVKSNPNHGTCFRFSLPRAGQ